MEKTIFFFIHRRRALTIPNQSLLFRRKDLRRVTQLKTMSPASVSWWTLAPQLRVKMTSGSYPTFWLVLQWTYLRRVILPRFHYSLESPRTRLVLALKEVCIAVQYFCYSLHKTCLPVTCDAQKPSLFKARGELEGNSREMNGVSCRMQSLATVGPKSPDLYTRNVCVHPHQEACSTLCGLYIFCFLLRLLDK